MIFSDLLSQYYDCPGTGHPGLSCSKRAPIELINDGWGYVFVCEPNTNDIFYLCAIPNHNVLSMGLRPPPTGNIHHLLLCISLRTCLYPPLSS